MVVEEKSSFAGSVVDKTDGSFESQDETTSKRVNDINTTNNFFIEISSFDYEIKT